MMFLLTFALATAAIGADTVMSLDGTWQLALDPRNEGREQKWFEAPRPDAKPAPVPGIIQEVYPGYHGAVWYYREFTPAALPWADGRHLLRFEAVDYFAEVWVNGQRVGSHEGGETPFELDATAAIRPGAANRLAVRVINPTNEGIDGMKLLETARRCKVIPFNAGAAFNSGGLAAPVSLRTAPAARIDDVHLVPKVVDGVGRVHAEMTVQHTGAQPAAATLELALAPAASGQTLVTGRVETTLRPGGNKVTVDLTLNQPRLWQINDPTLYRATARLTSGGAADERSTRFGFRDFRLERGYFRLNGKRVYLRSTHTCNHYPVGLQLPRDPDLTRRDLLNLKAMGFNMVRFIWGAATPEQLDYCDEIGLMVYQESHASAPLNPSPDMARRFDAAQSELIVRDRQHPSVVIWGLLNEATDAPAFRQAVAMLPLVHRLDDTRMVFLNSGRYDNVGMSAIAQVSGLKIWPRESPTEPWVGRNITRDVIRALAITWPAGHLAAHPGPLGEYSVVRFVAPTAGTVKLEAVFTGLAQRATTDVHVLHNGRAVWDGGVNVDGGGNEARHAADLTLAAGDRVDLVVGFGIGGYGGDTTGLAATFAYAGGKTYDATAEFDTATNPNGPWTYGQLKPGARPDVATFEPYGGGASAGIIGSACNPGQTAWQDIVSDRHVYPRVPHSAAVIDQLRGLAAGDQPVFLSEYGIGSAVDLWRAVRHFEQIGATEGEDAQFLRAKLDQFLTDYRAWHLDEIFPRPEDFFAVSLRKMAGQRTLGLNAIRSNAHIVGHSLTGAIDHVWCGEGLTTLFRELKPGTVDALFDAWYPLRWCLFAEPGHAYRGGSLRLEAVLANEDALAPGDYPVRLQVVGPDGRPVMDREITIAIPAPRDGIDPPLAIPCFDEQVKIDGPAGRYRFTATFERGAAAAGGVAEFDVTDPATMPAVAGDVALVGDDGSLGRWLAERGIRSHAFDAAKPPEGREAIVVFGRPQGDAGAVYRGLAERIARGSSVVYLDASALAEGDQTLRWLPLAQKGALVDVYGWLYLRDEWTRSHPLLDGLPAGGLMDYGYWRELIPDLLLCGQEPPAEAVAGAIKASQDYQSGLSLVVHRLGAGRFVVNTLRIREHLGRHPAAERLLRNLISDAMAHAQGELAPLPADWAEVRKRVGME
ncbi:MAG: glycoside hydrolase family 2 [Armatimonadetes bacterium]|nr:glycoside hydrolase family 2 [Armatimonadota bacterium]